MLFQLTHILNGERLVDVLAAGDGEPPAVAVVVPRQLDRHVLRRHGEDGESAEVVLPPAQRVLQISPWLQSTQKVST